MSHVIIVVPCYNEQRRFDVAAFLDFARRHRDVQFVLVDDGSTDGTGQVLAELEREEPKSFVAYDLPRNAGKAEAVRQGCLTAFRLEPDYVAYWDADLAAPLSAIEPLREALDRRPELLAVLGSRLPLVGHAVVRNPVRALLSRCFARAASWVLGVRVYDSQCGAKVFRAVPEVQSLFIEKFRTNWVFDVELLARLGRMGGRRDLAKLTRCVCELPLDAWQEKSGSKVKLRGFARAACELLVLFWTYRLRKSTDGALAPEIAAVAGESCPSQSPLEPTTSSEAAGPRLVGAGKAR